MFVLTILAALLAPTDAKIAMLDGQTHHGSLISISTSDVELTENSAAVKLPLDEVMTIEFPAAASVPSAELQTLFFADGSQVHATSFLRSAKSATAQTALFGHLETGVEEIHAVRLQADDPLYAQQWNTFLKRESGKDSLVVAKRDGSGLDFLAGIVNTVGADKIDFLLDGESIPVPAQRVYGIVFGRPAGAKTIDSGPGTAVRVTSAAGDLVAARTITLAGDQLQLQSSWGQQISVPVSQLRSIDLSAGRIQFLSDMPALSERFDGVDPENSLFAGLIDREQQALLFGPQRNMTIERQSKLRLRGREFTKGLCIHSRTEMKWSLEQRFSAIECVIGVDDEVAFNGTHAVAVKITGDETVLFEKLIATTDDPVPVRFPLDGVSTLTILVDFGDNSSVCDWLDIADARLVIAKDKK
ncbi:MAG TPA: NPCBM/NEW2 domain-containing protein [Planctomycetaceae bacterium]|nr:NPCBM/NEW2 domain-containing protein [Planctomycetaceae bacterium]